VVGSPRPWWRPRTRIRTRFHRARRGAGIDHSTVPCPDNTRFHYIDDEITVGEGRHTATICAAYVSSPGPESHDGPTISVTGVDERSLTVTEAEALRAALARAIERLADAEQMHDHDGEQRRWASVRQRTSPAMRAYAPPLPGEDTGDRQAA
jgi:hypothetical protein